MLLSIVIPTRNECRRIGVLLESLKKQTVRPEVLFIDGQSTDGTQALIERAGFKVIPEEGKRAPGNARNQGIAAATGEILASLNVDTILEPDYTKKIVKAFEEHPEADVIYFNHKRVVPEGMTVLGKAIFLRDQGVAYNGQYSVSRTSYWRKLDKYDTSLGFGEDRYIRQSQKRNPPRIATVSETISAVETSFQEFRGFVSRSLWYGRTIPAYLMKETDMFLSMFYLMSIMFLPAVLFAPVLAVFIFLIVCGYGFGRMLKVAVKGYLMWELILIPYLEFVSFVAIGGGFFQLLFGNKSLGR